MRALVVFCDERIAQPVSRVLLRTGLRVRSTSLVAVALVALTRKITVPGSPSRRTRGRRVVVLHKLGGTEDVVVTLSDRGASNLGLFKLQRSDIKTVFGTFVPESLGLDDFDYVRDDPAIGQMKADYRVFMAKVCRTYARIAGCAGFVTANLGYFAEREMAAACTQVGLPFVALHKESLRTVAQRPRYEAALRDHVGPFTGSAIAVYNDDERASQLRAGVASNDQITVIGCARIDEMHAMRRRARPPGQPTVTYFAIDPFAGTRQFTPDAIARHTHRPSSYQTVASEPPRWDDVARLTEEALLELAEEQPDLRLILKIKLGRSHQVDARLSGPLPANVEMVRGDLAAPYIERSSVVVGLNTTALTEAVAAGRRVVVPLLGEAASEHAADFLLDFTDAATFATTQQDLKSTVASLARTPPGTDLTAVEAALLKRYVGNPDGQARQRTFDWLQRSMPAIADPPPTAGHGRPVRGR